MENKEEIITKFGNKLLNESVDLDPKINDLLNDNFFDLLDDKETDKQFTEKQKKNLKRWGW